MGWTQIGRFLYALLAGTTLAVVIQIHMIDGLVNHTKELEEMDHLSIYAIRDKKAEAFHTPFFSPNHATAIRSFETIAQEQGHHINMHPEDYSLWYVGEWDADHGLVEGLPESQPIAQAIDFKPNPPAMTYPRVENTGTDN